MINEIPIWEKELLTVTEASQLFNIGQNRLRLLASEDQRRLGFESGSKDFI